MLERLIWQNGTLMKRSMKIKAIIAYAAISGTPHFRARMHGVLGSLTPLFLPHLYTRSFLHLLDYFGLWS